VKQLFRGISAVRAFALRSIAPLNTAWILGITGAVSLLNVTCGWYLADPYLAAGGVIGLAYVLLRPVNSVIARWRRRRTPRHFQPPRGTPFPPAPRHLADLNDADAVVRQMLDQGRYSLLLRPQIVQNLDDRHFRQTLELLHENMALVPEGEVVLGQVDDALDDGKLDDEEIRARYGRVILVECFFLDRYPVTNGEYYEFVSAGAYGQVALWDQTIWPAVLDLVDRSGQPGPRFWENGCYHPHKADHPVVGVSWYEARAYARWVGKRLPTDAEWVKAGSWPVKVSDNARLQRRYPWGESMDRARANLWASGRGGTVPVHEFPEGVSVGGVSQLIGNVWEWTRGGFSPTTADGEELLLEGSMKSIRGGAFDTYFDNQATCQFQSGEHPLARKPNVGFRCAVGVCDLVLARAAQHDASAEPSATPEEIAV
jgi:iron(II)-dependent oxidoreductase